MKKAIVLLIGIVIVAGLLLYQRGKQSKDVNTKTIIEMEVNENYDTSDPFVDARLFCVTEDIESLSMEMFFEMHGESGVIEILDRETDAVLGTNTWEENTNNNTVLITLDNIQKEKEYVIQFTGTKIKYATIKVTFDSELVQEKEHPSKETTRIINT